MDYTAELSKAMKGPEKADLEQENQRKISNEKKSKRFGDII